jgi:hypothetical protein
LIVVDRLFGTVAFDDFSLAAEEEEAAASSTHQLPSLFAVIVSPVSAFRPQGLAPPPLTTPIIVITSSSEPVSATEISAAGAYFSMRSSSYAFACLPLAFARVISCPVLTAPLSPGSWHRLTGIEAHNYPASRAITIPWPQSLVDALIASNASVQP